ncbi:hypothetical protein [Pantoea sp. PNT02]|uniref:hypothetical protein n=1 Tax=Pantoea sp. PNT02 TaxID=2769261 RepID=UPI00351BF179
MGVEFHITRAEYWAENDEDQISSDEWLDIINNDPELSLYTKHGEYHAIWNGEGAEEGAWLDWSAGNIETKWPNTALYRKMFQISEKLKAKVMDDEGRLYETLDAWQYDPKSRVYPTSDSMRNDSGVAAEHNAIQRFLSLIGLKKKNQ